jgi:flagellar protein FliO/FliZ
MKAAAIALTLGVCFAAPAFADPPDPEPTTTSTAEVRDPRAKALIETYEKIDAEARHDRGISEAPGFGAAFIQMLLVLGGVLALAYLILAKVLPRLMRIEAPLAPRKLLQVVDRLPIDQRKSILVLKMAGQYFLVGTSEGSIDLLSKLDPSEIEAALKVEVAPRGPILDSLLKRRPKEGES